MAYYDEIEIEDMQFNEEEGFYFYPCPCGDIFQITLEELQNGDEIAHCPSCSLVVRVIYDPEDFQVEQEVEVEVEKE
ncbi:hypothetical protein ABK040_009408 [Willaertia magna]